MNTKINMLITLSLSLLLISAGSWASLPIVSAAFELSNTQVFACTGKHKEASSCIDVCQKLATMLNEGKGGNCQYKTATAAVTIASNIKTICTPDRYILHASIDTLTPTLACVCEEDSPPAGGCTGRDTPQKAGFAP